MIEQTKYELRSKRKTFKGFISLTYIDSELAICDLTEATLSTEQKLWIWTSLPTNEIHLEKLISLFDVNKIELDLSFVRFWNEFKYKVGNKERSEKLFNNLKEYEKAEIFKHIPKYLYHLQLTRKAQVYPETFLAQRRWENELPKI